MKSAEEIAQWVINNRYPKSEKEKISDLEMYHTVKDAILKIAILDTSKSVCEQCTWVDLADGSSICSVCGTICPF